MGVKPNISLTLTPITSNSDVSIWVREKKPIIDRDEEQQSNLVTKTPLKESYEYSYGLGGLFRCFNCLMSRLKILQSY